MSEQPRLKLGDVFKVETGLKVQALIPKSIAFQSRAKPDEFVDGTFTVGETLSFGSKTFKTTKYLGEYLVIDAKMSGGSAPNDRDYFHPGYQITAQKLGADGEPDDQGVVISFYLSGHFNTCNPPEKVTATRRYLREVKVTWIPVEL
jgi:hypothetical protein